MIPVVNFVYPMFTNDDLLAAGRRRRPAVDPHRVRRRGRGRHRTRRQRLRLGRSRCRSRRPTASRTTSCRGPGPPAARMLNDGQPDLTNDDVTSRRRLHQGPLGRRRHRTRLPHHEGAGQGRGVHQRPRRHDDRLARAHQPHPRVQPRPELLASRPLPAEDGFDRRAGHPLRLVGHRRLRELRAQGRGLEARASSS